MDIQTILTQHWGIIVAFVVGAVYVLTHRQISINYAKTIIPKLMLAAEKYGQNLVLSSGQDKLVWVVNSGYDYLPSYVRVVVSKPLFASIAQSLFDEAITYAKTHVVSPVQPTQPVTTEPVITTETK